MSITNRDLFGVPRWKIVPDEWDQQKPLDIREDKPGGRLVASIAGSEAHGVDPGDMWEHATLLAQAPRLLDMLRQARDVVAEISPDDEPLTLLTRIDAAIADATRPMPIPARLPLVKRA